MVGHSRSVAFMVGALLGSFPALLLAAAASRSLWLAVAAGASVTIAGSALIVHQMRDLPGQRRMVGWTGIVGGGGIAVLNLAYPAAGEGFPGGIAVVWSLGLIMACAGAQLAWRIRPVVRMQAERGQTRPARPARRRQAGRPQVAQREPRVAVALDDD